jgi:hypothetical protein
MRTFLAVLGMALTVGAPVPKTRRWRCLCSVVLCLLVCYLAVPKRVGWLCMRLHEPIPCSEVERVAVSLAQGQGFCDAFGPGTGPTTHVAPLYPLVLSGLYRCTGSANPTTVRFVEGIPSIAAAMASFVLLPFMARGVGLPSRTGWAAALFLAGLPPVEWSEVSGHQETAWIGLNLVSVVGALGALRRQGWRRRGPVCATGVLLGITALLSPGLLLAAGLQLVTSLWFRVNRRQALAAVASLVGIALLVVLPWVVRNAIVFHRFIPLRGNFGLELALGNHEESDGRTYTPSFEKLHPWPNAMEREHLQAVGEVVYQHEKQTQARQWIAAHPNRFVWLTCRRAWLFVFAPRTLGYGSGGPLGSLGRIHGPLAAIALVGLVWLAFRRRDAAVPLAVVLFGFCLPYFLTHVNLRYRIPLPLLLALPAFDLILGALRTLWKQGQLERQTVAETLFTRDDEGSNQQAA